MNPSQLPQAGIADAGKDALLSLSQHWGCLINGGVRAIDPNICWFETCQVGRFFFCVLQNSFILCLSSKVRDSSSLLKTEDTDGIIKFLT